MPDDSVDVAIVGAGAVGLAAALTFAREGFRTSLIGPLQPRSDGRTVALFDGSIRFLQAIGAWPHLAPEAARMRAMRIVDDTGSLFALPPATFRSEEIGLPEFGWNIETADLTRGLIQACEEAPHLTLRPEFLAHADIGEPSTLHLQSGGAIQARLVVAADGRNSRLRESTGIATRTWSYPQAALTTILAHEADHQDISTEFHTHAGPFTLVPLSDRRSSLVWVTLPAHAKRLAALDDADLAKAIERQAKSMLGPMRIAGPRGVVPMGGLSVRQYGVPGLALVGEAAHVFPPIGAQGLNLGLRDVAALRDAVVDAGAGGSEPGGAGMLQRYQRGRDLDVRLRTGAVDTLNRTLLTDLWPADLLRGLGLLALGQIAPLRRAVMREGLVPSVGAPRLMRPTSDPVDVRGSIS